MTEFETWWYNEGSAPPNPGEDGEEHCKRMCQIAWENGAFCAVQPDRQALQSAGTHPAPCARHCEAQAFEIAARGMRRQIAELQAALAGQPAHQGQTDWEAVAADQAMTIAMLRAEQTAQQEENLYAYAGVKIWVGNIQASHFISRTAIEHEAIKGMCLHTAADWCLQELKERT